MSAMHASRLSTSTTLLLLPTKLFLHFALMSNQENFLDVMLTRCFHKACVNPHLDWLQSAIDLTNKQGFQVHNILGRFYLMKKDIEHLESQRLFAEHCEAVSHSFPDGADQQSKNKKHLDHAASVHFYCRNSKNGRSSHPNFKMMGC